MWKGVIFIIVVIFTLGSCSKKNQKIEFEGVVLDVKDNSPMSNVLIKLFVSNTVNNKADYKTLTESTWTNSNGEYEFTITRKDFTQYHVRAYKDQYVQFAASEFSGRWGRAYYYNNPNIDEFLVNYDTITLGRETILKTKLDILDTSNLYAIKFSDIIPLDSIERVLNDTLSLTSFLRIINSTNGFYDEIVNIYQYDIYPQRYVSWYKEEGELFYRKETVVAELTPFDTTYVDFVLE